MNMAASDFGFDDVREIVEKHIGENIPSPHWDKFRFFRTLPASGTILDVGCGNNSPKYTKEQLPGWTYIGLDIGDYNQQSSDHADRYIITSGTAFTSEILKLRNSVDAVVSSHNLEHCDDRTGTLKAMVGTLRFGGRMYLSFPCQDSVNFTGPRSGCLNYYDDCTHKDLPPDFGQVISILVQGGMRIIYANTRYQPPLAWIQGAFNEDSSVRDRQTKAGTWELWGFESIIWAERSP